MSNHMLDLIPSYVLGYMRRRMLWHMPKLVLLYYIKNSLCSSNARQTTCRIACRTVCCGIC